MLNKVNKRIIIIGPIFKNEKGYIGEGAKLYYSLKDEGYTVLTKSSIRNKIFRFIDIIWFCLFNLKKGDKVLLQSYAGLAFIMEDAVSRICKWKDVPIVFTLHGGAFIEFYQKHTTWVTKVLNRINIITTPSLFLQKHLLDVKFNIRYIPNYINLDRFKNENPNRKPFSILWVRGFHDIYNPELAIEALEILVKLNPNVHLSMIGKDQGLRAKCEELVSAKKLNNNITFYGYINNEDLPKFYLSNSVFISTTKYESFGVSLIEAAACGLPTVSTSVGEIPLLYKNEIDIMICERDPKLFAEAIYKLFTDSKLNTHISEAAYKKSKQYSWEKVGPVWNKIINNL